jgi:hypothetical protein
MNGQQELDNLMRKVIKVTPEELKPRLAADEQARETAKKQEKRTRNV